MRWTVAQVVERLVELGPKLIVFSGGEPLQQIPALLDIITLLSPDFRFAFETAGVLVPGDLKHVYGLQWSVSPKLASSGNPITLRYKPDILEEFRDLGADFKFVISTEEDVEEVLHIQDSLQIPSSQIWAMPEGTNKQTVLERGAAVAVYAHKYGWNLTLRQHVLLYDDERGK